MHLARHRCALVVALLLLLPFRAFATEYPLGPDSNVQPGVPQGKVTQHKWTSNKLFPGTERDYWVYVPAQYDGSQPACVMVFQDGAGFVKPDGESRATVVMDNLIHKKEMPVTIGIFISPGVIPAAGPNQLPRFNRSFEYDTPSDTYVRFLLEEILPEVGKTYKLTDQATGRGIIGASSGGICAFTAAWERPEAFSRVISFVGSFTDLRGGNTYPSLVRKTEPLPIRVFLQDGKNDLDIYSGSWFMANQDLDAALSFAGYEHQFVVGDEGHNGKHGGAILPDALRYIWKDYPKLPAKGTFPKADRDGRPSVVQIIDPADEWQLIPGTYKFTEGPAADANGNVFFCDLYDSKIYKIDADGKVGLFAANTQGANGLVVGTDGRLYAAQSVGKRVVAYNVADAKDEVIADDVEGNDLEVNAAGGIYVTESNRHRITYISPKREKRVVDHGLSFPNGVALTPDQGQLVVADMKTRNLFAFRVEADGSLTNKQPYFALAAPAGATDASGNGIAVDADGRVYSTSSLGVQVCDPAGRVNAILRPPQHVWPSNVCFGGKNLDTLYVTCGDKVFKRKVKVKGTLSFQPPVLPPKPKL
jgi:sugar lactone lactonase YvrE/enterochelin esterase-like enzyme